MGNDEAHGFLYRVHGMDVHAKGETCRVKACGVNACGVTSYNHAKAFRVHCIVLK